MRHDALNLSGREGASKPHCWGRGPRADHRALALGEGEKAAVEPFLHGGAVLARTVRVVVVMDDTASQLSAIRPAIEGLARSMARRYRGLIDLDEAIGLAELGCLEAWRTRRLHDRERFSSYAKAYARGRILRHLRVEHRHRQLQRERIPRIHGGSPSDPETTALARRLLSAMTTEQRAVFVRHAYGGDSLADIARDEGRHRAWGSRTYATARDAAHAAVRDSPFPRD